MISELVFFSFKPGNQERVIGTEEIDVKKLNLFRIQGDVCRSQTVRLSACGGWIFILEVVGESPGIEEGGKGRKTEGRETESRRDC